MAIPKTVITGKVLLPSGAAPAGGTLTARLSQSGSALDGAVSHRVASSIRVDLGADGSLPAGFGLCPNDAIVPTGTYYRIAIVMRDDRGVPYSAPEEKWQVATSPSPIDIGAVPRIDTTPGVAATLATAWPELSAAAVSSAQASATAASGSATTASGHATAAASSASAASGSVTTAAGHATSAASSATTAAGHATTAEGHASAAQTARSGAESAQTSAAGSASAASASATTAAGHVTTAAGHATAAAGSATSAASSASSASSNATLLSDSMANVSLSSARTNSLATQDAAILRSLWDRRAGVLSRVRISDLPAGALATPFVGTLGEPLAYAFSRPGTGHVRVDGTLIDVTNNIPRIEQTPRGIGIQPANTNLLLTSSDPTGWSKSGVTMTKPGTVAAPDGSLTGLRVDETDTTGNHWFWPPTAAVTIGALHPHSVYVKAGTRSRVGIRDSGSQNNAQFNLATGTVVSSGGQTGITAGIVDCGSGWYRIWMRSQRNATPSALVIMVEDDGGSNNYTGVSGSAALYLWQPQVGPAGATLGPPLEAADVVPVIAAAESLTVESRVTGAHRSWCRSITAKPCGSWADVKQLWSQGSGANSARLAVESGNLTFAVVDSAGAEKTLAYPVTSIAAGVHTLKAAVRDGALAMYIDGVSVGSAGGTGTGLVASLPATLYLGGAPGSEFGGTLSDFVESDNSVPTNCPPPEPSVVTSSASSVRALFISDTHGMASYIADAVAKGKGWAPHLLAHCGDIVWEPADDAAWATAWSPLNSVFQSSGVARGMVLGNHDVNSAGLTAAGVRAAWPADMTARLQPAVFYGSQDIAGVRFIFLDATYQSVEPATRTGMGSGTNNVAGYLPQVELDWLYALIDASTIPCVLIMHQPLLIDGGVGVVTNAATVRTALESRKTKIACVVNGHNHRPAFAALNGINYFACNAMNSPFEAITTHDRGLHQQLEVDTASRVARFSWWENDSVKGYLEVRTVIAPY